MHASPRLAHAFAALNVGLLAIVGCSSSPDESSEAASQSAATTGAGASTGTSSASGGAGGAIGTGGGGGELPDGTLGTADHLSQFGITWTFDHAYPYGQF